MNLSAATHHTPKAFTNKRWCVLIAIVANISIFLQLSSPQLCKSLERLQKTQTKTEVIERENQKSIEKYLIRNPCLGTISGSLFYGLRPLTNSMVNFRLNVFEQMV